MPDGAENFEELLQIFHAGSVKCDFCGDESDAEPHSICGRSFSPEEVEESGLIWNGPWLIQEKIHRKSTWYCQGHYASVCVDESFEG